MSPIRRARPAAGAVWLAFLPNAPYLVTDLIHLSGHDELWRHVLQFGFAASTGTLLGVVSLRIVHVEVEGRVATFFGIAYLTTWALDGLQRPDTRRAG